MACVNADGTVTTSARAVLQAATQPVTPAEVAKTTGFPLFRIRSSLRELQAAGLVADTDGTFVITEAGQQRLTGA